MMRHATSAPASAPAITPPAAAACRPRSRPAALVVIAGDDVYEDLFTASLKLQDLLSTLGFATRAVMGTARLTALSDGSAASSDSTASRAAASLAATDLIVLYMATGQFPPATQKALADIVATGTGLIAIHASNVFPSLADQLDQSHRQLFDLIGSRYVSHGPHPHHSRFTVHADQNHPLTSGLAPFEISHEHYELELSPAARVLAWRDTTQAASRPAHREPVLHVRELGSGRVTYLQLGHDMRAFDDPAVRDLLTRCATWARRDHRSGPAQAEDPR